MMMAKRDIDKYFRRNGPCMFHSTRYAKHRLIDAIRGRHKAGESIAELAKDYRLSRAAIKAAINASPDDNRMTAKEVRETRQRIFEYVRERAKELAGGES